MPMFNTVAIATLKPHRLQQQVFPGRKADDAMIESVRNLGVIESPSVSADGVILSGCRRVDAAEACGLETLEVRVWDCLGDSPDADEIWVDSNVERSDLTNEERARLYLERKRIEEERAKGRSEAAKKAPRKKEQSAETEPGNLPDSNSDTDEPSGYSQRKTSQSSRDRAAADVGLSGKTAEKLGKAVTAKDAAVAAGDHKAAERIKDAIETNATKAVQTAAETGYLPAEDRKPEQSPEKAISKLREKAASSITAFVRALEPHEQDIKLRSLLSECGVATGDDLSDNLKPHTAEEFIVWMKDSMEDLTTKEHTKASELAIVDLLQNVRDPSKLITMITDGRQLKPAVYLSKLPDEHAAATELVEQELKIRFKQLKGFENWDQNGRPVACRSLCKVARGQVKGFENHCAVGDEEQPALIDVAFPEKLDTPVFRKVWAEYWDHRKKTKKPITETVRTRSFNNLTKFAGGTVEDAIAIVGKTIESNWNGIPDGIWDTIWTGPDAGKKRPEAPAAKSAGESAPEFNFEEIVMSVKRSWHPDVKDRDAVLSELSKSRSKKDAELIFNTIFRAGISTIFLLNVNSPDARPAKSRFFQTLEVIRNESKGAA